MTIFHIGNILCTDWGRKEPLHVVSQWRVILCCVFIVYLVTVRIKYIKDFGKNSFLPFPISHRFLQTLAFEHIKPDKPITVNVFCLKINRQSNFIFHPYSKIAVLEMWNRAGNYKPEQRIFQCHVSGRKLTLIPVDSTPYGLSGGKIT